jgi:HSP20 family protein
LAPVRELVNRLFDDTFLTRPGWPGSIVWDSWQPAGLGVDLYEQDERYTVVVAVPGVKQDSIDLNVQGSTLTLSVEVPEQTHEGRVWAQEMRRGSFQRRIDFPTEIDADAVQAELDNGVLTLTVPKAEAQRTRRIPVTIVDGRK